MILRPPNPTASLQFGYDTLVTQRVESDGSVYYLASHPELKGCKAHGATLQEAVANLADALDLYRDMAAETGTSLPSPHGEPHVTLGFDQGHTESGSATSVLTVQGNWKLTRVDAVGDDERQPMLRGVDVSSAI